MESLSPAWLAGYNAGFWVGVFASTAAYLVARGVTMLIHELKKAKS